MAKVQIPLVAKGTSYIQRGVFDLEGKGSAPFAMNAYYLENKASISESRKLQLCKRPPVYDCLQKSFDTDIAARSSHKIRAVNTSLDKTRIIWISTNGSTEVYGGAYDFATAAVTHTDITAIGSSFTNNYIITQLDPNSYNNYGYVATDFDKAFVINDAGTAFTEIAGAGSLNFETGIGNAADTKTNIVAMDGYLFVGVRSGTNAGRLYNSDLNTPLTWTSTSFLTPAEYPGQLLWLSRIGPYLAVFKQYSIEFMENVGNPTPGSPLSPVPELTKNIGVYSKSSIKEVSDGIIFVGRDTRGQVGIYKLSQNDYTIKKVSDSYIDAMLNTSGANAFPPDSKYSVDHVLDTSIYGQSQVISFDDKELYTIMISAVGSSLTGGITLVYDNHLGIWTIWNAVDATYSYFPYFQCFKIYGSSTQGYMSFIINNQNSTARFAYISTLAGFDFQDHKDGTSGNNVSYEFSFVSDMLDFGTESRKFFNSVTIIYDSDPTDDASTTLTPFNIVLSYYNLDYQMGSAAGRLLGARTITAQSGSYLKATAYRLGSGRSRAFSITTTHVYPMRIYAIEIDYDLGESSANTQ